LESAHRHGVSEEDMLQALRFAIHHVRQDDDMVMFIGPDASGSELVEVGVVIWLGWRTGHRPRNAPSPRQVPTVIQMRHSLADLIANADRLADEFEHYDPKPADFDASLPPLMAVKLAAFRRAAAEKELAAAIRAAREAHLSWRELGEAIGTSGEAARQRYAS